MGNDSGVFVIGEDGKLAKLTATSFANEDLFQQLLADYPSLIPGSQIDPANPRRWLPVTRELGVPIATDGPDHFALDHLFLDQDGVPTFIEVKRKTDTRARREVVSQMLDYAANAVEYVPVQRIRSVFEEQHEHPEEIFRLALGDEIDYEAFWGHVKTNLEAGRLRLLFVADQVPQQLRRIVEFLNAQTDPLELLAVEIPLFQGSGIRALVPMVYGQTELARVRKSAGGQNANRRKWDWDSFATKLGTEQGPEPLRIAERIKTWFESNASGVSFGTNIRGSFIPLFNPSYAPYPLVINADGTVTLQFRKLGFKGKYGEPQVRQEFLQRFNDALKMDWPNERAEGSPSFPITVLADENTWNAFVDVLTWIRDDAQAHWATHDF